MARCDEELQNIIISKNKLIKINILIMSKKIIVDNRQNNKIKIV